MITVALIGADGAGKTTIGRRLERDDQLRVKYLYMGTNTDSSNVALPTTRLARRLKRAVGAGGGEGGPPDPDRVRRPRGVLRRTASGVKSNLRIINQLAEEWYRQAAAWSYRRRGHVVLFDRHFYADFYAHDVTGNGKHRPLLGRLHGFLLRRVYPKPDVTILLDAPASVLFERKAEGTVELVDRRRREYLQLSEQLPNFSIVDATRSADEVTAEVLGIIRGFMKSEGA